MFYIRISTKKKMAIQFSQKKFSHKCLFKIPLWRVDDVTSYLLISSKNLKWKQHFHGIPEFLDSGRRSRTLDSGS